ncbi:MAG: hypothetical protein MJZ37_07310 [Bacilli bacterium]|nr:hypothetical protein [Bacilli bacterium]
MAEKEIVVSNKHVKLRIILTATFFVIAVVSIAIGVTQIGKKDPGIYTIEPKTNDEYPTYGVGFKGVFDFSNEATNSYKEYEDTMSRNLQLSYGLFDETKIYTAYNSISNVCLHPNEEMTLSPQVYEVFSDALSKTHEDKNYSIYSAPIYSYWDWLFSLDDNLKEANDPKNNEDNRTLLTNLVTYCAEPYVRLELKENNKAILHVEQEYLDYREAQNITAPLVSLNVLKDAYRMQMLVDAFNELGFTNGYLYHESDLYVSLKDHTHPVYSLYDYRENKLNNYAAVQIGKPSCAVSLKRFVPTGADYVPTYKLNDGTIRNSFINIKTGYGDETYVSTSLFSKSNNIVEMAYKSNYLASLSISEAQTMLTNEYCALTTVNNPYKAYVTSELAQYTEVNTKIGYELEQL